MKVILIPGMGCTPVASSNWYSWLADQLQQRQQAPAVECIVRDFPDPYLCRESIWIPYVMNHLIGREETTTSPEEDDEIIVIGHSSGAACTMRLLERYGNGNHCDASSEPKPPKLRAAILVAAAHTDLGDEDERRSEYFQRPWDWDAMKRGADRIILFHGTDDHLIPVDEARYIAKQLHGKVEYHEMNGKSHFFQPWPELLHVIDDIIVSSAKQEMNEWNTNNRPTS